MALYTVGHGNRSLDDLAVILAEGNVGRLADVRRFPGSRRHPHFSREALEAELPARGVDYEWWGEALGGRRSPEPDSRHPAWRDAGFRGYADHMDGAEFRQTLTGLLAAAAGERVVAVMCAEILWWRCHRRLIADASVVRGTPVIHLLASGRSQSHPRNAALRVGADGWPVYDVGVDRPLW
ncbi:MAG TPA: DUF488 domain-containing protein [Acidimicrobiales bacterium]